MHDIFQTLYILTNFLIQERPYNHDSTASRLLSEVKHDLARLVLRSGTTLEYRVLFFLLLLLVKVQGRLMVQDEAEMERCDPRFDFCE